MSVGGVVSERFVGQNKPSLLELGVEGGLAFADAALGEHAMSDRTFYCAGHSKRQYTEVWRNVH